MTTPDGDDAARYVEPPAEFTGTGPAVFLAGGITGCEDWQARARVLLAPARVTLLNPRRARFPMDDPSAAAHQIDWEYRHLRRADVVLFWFPAASGPEPAVQPIALYELGAHAATGRAMAVGCHPRYVRRTDVVLQLGHARPDVTVRDTLSRACADVVALLHRTTPRGGRP